MGLAGDSCFPEQIQNAPVEKFFTTHDSFKPKNAKLERKCLGLCGVCHFNKAETCPESCGGVSKASLVQCVRFLESRDNRLVLNQDWTRDKWWTKPKNWQVGAFGVGISQRACNLLRGVTSYSFMLPAA